MRFKLMTLDVWGNAVDGYDLNNVFDTGVVLDIPEGASDDDVRRLLRDGGHLKRGVRLSSIGIDDASCEGRFLTVTDDRRPRLSVRNPERVAHGWGKPVFQLIAIDEN